MAKPSRQHRSDEFGQMGSSSVSGLDAPMIGASASIMVDGMVEQESGRTPSPWSLSVGQIAAILAVMFLAGVIVTGLLFVLRIF